MACNILVFTLRCNLICFDYVKELQTDSVTLCQHHQTSILEGTYMTNSK